MPEPVQPFVFQEGGRCGMAAEQLVEAAGWSSEGLPRLPSRFGRGKEHRSLFLPRIRFPFTAAAFLVACHCRKETGAFPGLLFWSL